MINKKTTKQIQDMNIIITKSLTIEYDKHENPCEIVYLHYKRETKRIELVQGLPIWQHNRRALAMAKTFKTRKDKEDEIKATDN